MALPSLRDELESMLMPMAARLLERDTGDGELFEAALQILGEYGGKQVVVVEWDEEHRLRALGAAYRQSLGGLLADRVSANVAVQDALEHVERVVGEIRALDGAAVRPTGRATRGRPSSRC